MGIKDHLHHIVGPIVADIDHYVQLGLDAKQVVAAVLHTHERAGHPPDRLKAIEAVAVALLNARDAFFPAIALEAAEE